MPDATPRACATRSSGVLRDAALRERLAANGHATATTYAWPDKLDQLDRRFRTLAAQRAQRRAVA